MRHYRTEHNPIFWKKKRSRFGRNCSDLIDLMQAESSPLSYYHYLLLQHTVCHTLLGRRG